jgi:hypothetical protein
LKPLHREAIPAALAKAERYRLLNEPHEAESICLDVLQVEPDNQHALITLVLALSDAFESGAANTVARAWEVQSRLHDPYERAYYAGIICERRARVQLSRGAPGAGFNAYDWLREAMGWFEKAESIRPPGNDDAILRWNTCARILMSNPELRPRSEETFEHPLE